MQFDVYAETRYPEGRGNELTPCTGVPLSGEPKSTDWYSVLRGMMGDVFIAVYKPPAISFVFPDGVHASLPEQASAGSKILRNLTESSADTKDA